MKYFWRIVLYIPIIIVAFFLISFIFLFNIKGKDSKAIKKVEGFLDWTARKAGID